MATFIRESRNITILSRPLSSSVRLSVHLSLSLLSFSVNAWLEFQLLFFLKRLLQLAMRRPCRQCKFAVLLLFMEVLWQYYFDQRLIIKKKMKRICTEYSVNVSVTSLALTVLV